MRISKFCSPCKKCITIESTHVCVFMYIYIIYTYVHIYEHACMYVYINVSVHIYIYIHFICTYMLDGYEGQLLIPLALSHPCPHLGPWGPRRDAELPALESESPGGGFCLNKDARCRKKTCGFVYIYIHV